MRRRNIVVNTLLGIFLLLTALMIYLAFVGAGWLGLSVIKSLTGRFLPDLVIPANLLLLLIYGISAVRYGVAHLRRKLWRNAFLCLVVIPVIGSMWLGHPFSIFGAGRLSCPGSLPCSCSFQNTRPFQDSSSCSPPWSRLQPWL